MCMSGEYALMEQVHLFVRAAEAIQWISPQVPLMVRSIIARKSDFPIWGQLSHQKHPFEVGNSGCNLRGITTTPSLQFSMAAPFIKSKISAIRCLLATWLIFGVIQ